LNEVTCEKCTLYPHKAIAMIDSHIMLATASTHSD